jgi:hypothetical protein
VLAIPRKAWYKRCEWGHESPDNKSRRHGN